MYTKSGVIIDRSYCTGSFPRAMSDRASCWVQLSRNLGKCTDVYTTAPPVAYEHTGTGDWNIHAMVTCAASIRNLFN